MKDFVIHIPMIITERASIEKRFLKKQKKAFENKKNGRMLVAGRIPSSDLSYGACILEWRLCDILLENCRDWISPTLNRDFGIISVFEKQIIKGESI